jgi:hypothetical protein
MWSLWLMIWLLTCIGGGCDGSNMLICWIVLPGSLVGHHTDFLFIPPWKIVTIFLRTTSRRTIFHYSSFSDTFLYTYTYADHLCEAPGCVPYHFSVVEWTESSQKQLGHLILFHPWANLGGKIPPSMSIPFKRFSIPLS